MQYRKITWKTGVAIITASVFALVIAAIFWNSAREEIYFLCGNFSAGVEKASVVRQLDTANLSGYKQIATEDGSKVVFSSKLNFGVHQCIIEFDSNNRVIRTRYM